MSSAPHAEARPGTAGAAAGSCAAISAEPAGTSFWLRTVVGWHIVFWAVLVASAVAAGFADLDSTDRAAYLGLLVVLGLAYALLGQPAATTRDRLRSHLYRLILVVVLGGLAAYFPNVMMLLYIAYPQLWFLSERVREGIVFSILLTVSVTVGIFAAGDWSLSALGNSLPWMLVSLSVSLVLGIWIARVVDQSEERAALIRALQATREELAAAHHAAGVVAERERMAREIHDTLAQGFTSIVMLAETASEQLARDRPDLAARQLAAIEAAARDNLGEARALVAALSPVRLHGDTLPAAVRRLATRFGAETGVAVDVRFQPDEQAVAALHASQQVVLLRAAQEALTNVRKHAGASRVSVTISADPQQAASIEVGDDGSGFEPAVTRNGFGLAGMRGRVEEAGGTVQVDSAPGHGTRVEVQLPFQAAAALPS